MKYLRQDEEIAQRFAENTKVFKMKLHVQVPSFSLAMLNHDAENSLIAEMVYWNFNFWMDKLLDRRTDLRLKAHSLQILRKSAFNFHSKPSSVNTNRQKAIVIGHISAHNYLVTDEDYYNFNIDRIIQQVGQPTGRDLRKRR